MIPKANIPSRQSFPKTPYPPINTSRLSLNNSTVSHQTEPMSQTMRSGITSIISKYPKCQLKKLHNKQLLNLVCLTDNCKWRGAICSICKSSIQHQGHNVVTLKRFIEMIETGLIKFQRDIPGKRENKAVTEPILEQPITVQSPIIVQEQESKNMAKNQKVDPQTTNKTEQKSQKQQISFIQSIQNHKNRMLYALQAHIIALSQQIRAIEQRILQEIRQKQQQIKNADNFQKNLSAIITQIKQNQHTDETIFRSKVGLLFKYTNFKNKQICEIKTISAPKCMEGLAKTSEQFIANLSEWSQGSSKKLAKIFEHNPDRKIVVQNKQKDQTNNAQTYKFNPDQKIKSIILFNQNKIAKLQSKVSGFVFFSSPIAKDKKFKIKIISLSNIIMLGIGNLEAIQANGYKFTNMNNLGHGGYLVGSNNMTYSAHFKAQNNVNKGFGFVTGDQITVKIKEQSISFIKKSQPNKTVALQFKKIAVQEWKNFAGCAYLGGPGDVVEISSAD